MKDNMQALRHEAICYAREHSVTEACKLFNISRTTYYKWLKRYHIYGIDGLKNKEKNIVSKNKASKATEYKVLSLVCIYPSYGPRSLSYIMQDMGYDISESGVYNILKRYNLTRASEREFYAQNNKNTFKYPAEKVYKLPNIEEINPGDLLICWTIYLEYIRGTGNYYQIAVMDACSGFIFLKLYQHKNVTCSLDLLQGTVIPTMDTFEIDIKAMLTQDSVEYTPLKAHGRNKYTSTLRNHNIRQLRFRNEYSDYINLAKQFQDDIYNNLYKNIFSSKKSFNINEINAIIKDHINKYNFKTPKKYIPNKGSIPIDIIKENKNINIPLWLFIESN